MKVYLKALLYFQRTSYLIIVLFDIQKFRGVPKDYKLG